MELLAPAGTLEAGIAALQYGADAVYLGMKNFSARADAGNFNEEELTTLLGIARQDREHPRKVYVAVNTLLREHEIPEAISLLAQLEQWGVDGVIVQDMAIASLIRRHFPSLPLHASTQLAIHNAEGVQQAKRLGFTRVVAARELSLTELRQLCAVPGMEVETFLHGALCYSYSGLCLMSACLRGPSGNHGECTYLCRNKFRFEGLEAAPAPCCPMSMKDLALGALIPELQKAGVASLKIEGRKKTPLYVAAAVNYYRKWLDGSFAPGEEKECARDVQTIFSRPWTRLYAQSVYAKDTTDPHTTGPRGVEAGNAARITRLPSGEEHLRFTVRNCTIERHDGLQIELPGQERPYGFGIPQLYQFTQGGGQRFSSVFTAAPGSIVEVPLPEGHPDITQGAKITHTSSQAIKRKYSWPSPRPELSRARIPLDCTLEIASREITVQCRARLASAEEIACVTRYPLESSPARAEHTERVEHSVRQAFSRMGDSLFRPGAISLKNPQGYFLPSSLLNDVRRQALTDISLALEASRKEKIRSIVELDTAPVPAPVSGGAPSCFSLKIDRVEYLNALQGQELSAFQEIVFALDLLKDFSMATAVLEELRKKAAGIPVRLAIPVIQRPIANHDWRPLLRQLLSDGWQRWECGNLGHFRLLEEAGASGHTLDLTADWGLYASNHLAGEMLREMGCRRFTLCPEDPLEEQLETAAASPERATAILWQRPVLARSATCIVASARGSCLGPERCGFGQMTIENSRNERMIAVNDQCHTVLLPEAPLDFRPLLSRFQQKGVRHFRYDLLWNHYTGEEIRQILMP